MKRRIKMKRELDATGCDYADVPFRRTRGPRVSIFGGRGHKTPGQKRSVFGNFNKWLPKNRVALKSFWEKLEDLCASHETDVLAYVRPRSTDDGCGKTYAISSRRPTGTSKQEKMVANLNTCTLLPCRHIYICRKRKILFCSVLTFGTASTYKLISSASLTK